MKALESPPGGSGRWNWKGLASIVCAVAMAALVNGDQDRRKDITYMTLLNNPVPGLTSAVSEYMPYCGYDMPEAPEPGAPEAPEPEEPATYWPVGGDHPDRFKVGSGFGPRVRPSGDVFDHDGMDVVVPSGESAVACKSGKFGRVWRVKPGCECSIKYDPCKSRCTREDVGKGNGNYIMILHDDGTSTEYKHLDSIVDGVEVGKRVKGGEKIGIIGNTGISVGSHLHFTYRNKKDIAVDPLTAFDDETLGKITGRYSRR